MKKAHIVVGLGFGDEGKGALVDTLTDRHSAGLVVRYNGGAQAAHNVIANGVHHTFSMFGSGTLAGASTYLGPGVRVDPVAMKLEADQLKLLGISDPLSRLSISEDCLIVTPIHALISRQNAPIHQRGSCGMGVGVVARFEEANPGRGLRASDLSSLTITAMKLSLITSDLNIADQALVPSDTIHEVAYSLCEWATSVAFLDDKSWRWLRDSHDDLIFEGAQGILLDRKLGFTPYVTSSDTTTAEAIALLNGWDGLIETIGVTRLAPTRHGPGPFPTEDPLLRQALPEAHNRDGLQGAWRVGWPDLHLLDYAIHATPRIDSLAVSRMDDWTRIPSWKVADKHRWGDRPRYFPVSSQDKFLDVLVNQLGIGLSYIGEGAGRQKWGHA